jgi:hypothetical protein
MLGGAALPDGLADGAVLPWWLTWLAEPLHPAIPATVAGTMTSSNARRQQLRTMKHLLRCEH